MHTDELKPLNKESARAFRLELQEAREGAIKDAEAFDGIIHAIERLGTLLKGEVAGLAAFAPKMNLLAGFSPLASGMVREWHTPFALLYDMVRNARNDALHVGSYARHLTSHAIELALILEDGLRSVEIIFKEAEKMEINVSDFMVRNPVCAHLWQPISSIRQTMLTNSFSYLPVAIDKSEWRLVSDLRIVAYLHGCSNAQRKIRLARPLGEAMKEAESPVKLDEVERVSTTATIEEALRKSGGKFLLVFSKSSESELAGILTPFDLL